MGSSAQLWITLKFEPFKDEMLWFDPAIIKSAFWKCLRLLFIPCKQAICLKLKSRLIRFIIIVGLEAWEKITSGFICLNRNARRIWPIGEFLPRLEKHNKETFFLLNLLSIFLPQIMITSLSLDCCCCLLYTSPSPRD